MLGAYKEIQQQTFKLVGVETSSDTVEEVAKSEEVTFELEEKRFLILMVKYISYERYYNTSSHEAKSFYDPITFIIDTIEKKAYTLTTTTKLFEGEDFTASPNGYEICRETSNMGIGFYLKDVDSNVLKIQPFAFNDTTTSTKNYTFDFSISFELCEFLAYKEG